MSIIDDEQIIKRRLQIDGEGVGDDRKINLLLKTYTKWCTTPSSVDNNDAHDRILTQLSQCEFSVLKSDISEHMMDEEMKNYKKISDNIAERIEQIRDQIEQSKDLLEKAKEIRRNKLEYLSLARLINQEPERVEVVAKYQELQEELLTQNEHFLKASQVLENRRKDFAAFMFLTKELLRDCNFDVDNSTETNDEETEGGIFEDDGDIIADADDIEKMIIE
ncbi:CLUMA_CG005436, isoform A [Clunio marinus]|uniref:CLUMA_CG005436, isoform A n=1 Tax=Clunio marinus TaxID=568069 RepID=A0A1J1HUY3_9DIPT|nr:CLUMA_CG005436, isoform A [Clunio marinus]